MNINRFMGKTLKVKDVNVELHTKALESDGL